MIFAVTSLMLLGGIGLAIDTSDAHNVRSELQAACDSVALAESISIYNGGELNNESAKVLMEENFLYDSDDLSLEMQESNGQVTCNASYIKETIFSSVLQLNELTISVVSEATAIASPESINLSIDLANISSDARNWNQLFVYTYEGDFDINTLQNRTLLVENKTGASTDFGDQDYIDQQTQTPHSQVIPEGHSFGLELSSTNSVGEQNRYFSDLLPENLEVLNPDCFSGLTQHSWEDKIEGGDGDFNDMEYTISCDYQDGGTTQSVTSRLIR